VISNPPKNIGSPPFRGGGEADYTGNRVQFGALSTSKLKKNRACGAKKSRLRRDSKVEIIQYRL